MASSRIASTLVLAAGIAGAVEPLKLENYVSADFHRAWLSVEPQLTWSAGGNERHRKEDSRVSDQYGPFGTLRLRHGSERFTQSMRWNLDCGSELAASRSGNERESRAQPGTGGYSHEEKNDQSEFRYSAFTRGSVRRYFGGGLFLEPTAELDWSHTPASDNANDSWYLYRPSSSADSLLFHRSRSRTESDRQRISGKARLQAGYGRIQDVGFAETGLFLLDRLAATTGKPLALDAQGMRELEAAVEARRKQRPFLDARAAAIYDMETIAAFLQDRRGGEALPVRTVLEMADEWGYARRHDRKSGWEVKGYPFVESYWRDDEEHSSYWRGDVMVPAPGSADPDSLARALEAAGGASRHDRIRFFETHLKSGAALRADWNRPFLRYWQFNAMAFGRVSRVDRENGDHRVSDSAGVPGAESHRYLEIAYPTFESGALLEAAWYPNTRTALSAALDMTWNRSFDYLGSKSGLAEYLGRMPDRETENLRTTVRFGGEYWLSHRLTATGLIQVAWNYDEYRDAVEYLPAAGEPLENGSDTGSSLWMNAGLRYYLF